MKKIFVWFTTLVFVGALAILFLIFVKNTRHKTCLMDDCTNDVFKDDLCFKHYKEKSFVNNPSVQDATSQQNSINSDAKTINKGERITIDGICEITVVRTDITSVVIPPNVRQNKYYRYFESDKGSRFVDVIVDIKNLRDYSIKQDEVVKNSYVTSDSSIYNCSYIVEEDDGKELQQYTSIYAIDAKEKMRYHMVAEIPESELNNTLKYYVYVEEETFCFEIRK